jgi:uncharacterized protein
MQPRVIRVQGHATIAKNPDTVVLSFSISGRDMKYDQSIKRVNTRVETLREELERLGIDQKALKTTNFSIQSDSRYDDRKKEHVFLGYVCNHSLQLELPFDKEELGKIIDTLAGSISHAEMRISFGILDKEGLRLEMLDKAVQVAKSNAEVLARSAGVKLGQIQNIEYGWSEIRFGESVAYDSNMICESLAEIEPKDIEAEDSVTVTWELV